MDMQVHNRFIVSEEDLIIELPPKVETMLDVQLEQSQTTKVKGVTTFEVVSVLLADSGKRD